MSESATTATTAEPRKRQLEASARVMTDRIIMSQIESHQAAEAYARKKTGHAHGFTPDVNAHIVLFTHTRAGRRLSKQRSQLTKMAAAIAVKIKKIDDAAEARREVAAGKAESRRRLIQINLALSSARVYSFSERRRACWGRICTIHTITSHRLALHPDGRYLAGHADSYETVHIYRESDARKMILDRGDAFVSGAGGEIPTEEIIRILSKMPRKAAPLPHGGELVPLDQYNRQLELRLSYERYSNILSRRSDPQNTYARWLISLGACTAGICAAMECGARSPEDTIRLGSPSEAAWLRRHANLLSGGSPQVHQMTEGSVIFPDWEMFKGLI